MKTTMISLAAATLLCAACANNRQQTTEPIGQSGRTLLTEAMLQALGTTAADSTYMFGHHDDTMYGIGWVADYQNDSTVGTRSDVLSVCGDLPAILSFDLGHIELSDSVNLDGVPFDRMRKEIILHYERGGIVTLSWHLNNPLSGGTSWVADSLRDVETKTVAAVLEGGSEHDKFISWVDRVADFLNALVMADGRRVPVIFRPWHEHTGSWFWWGQDHCTTEQYKQLWKTTVDRLRHQGVVNVLYAYSPNIVSEGTIETLMERYPGDDIIDIIGYDQYCYAPEGDSADVNRYAHELDHYLDLVCQAAKEHGKVAALTETGYESIPSDNWWTATLAPVLRRHPIAYVVVWRNAHDKPGHFYAPFPEQQSAADFVRFHDDPHSLFLSDTKPENH